MISSPEPEWMHASEEQVQTEMGSPTARGMGDAEITPKPLRIVKRRNRTVSSSANAKDIPSLAKSNTQQALIPHRRSSSSTGDTQLDLSQRDPTLPTSAWSRRHTFLNVRKQRRSDPSETITSAGSRSLDHFDADKVSSPPERHISRGNVMMSRLESGSQWIGTDPACKTRTSAAQLPTSNQARENNTGDVTLAAPAGLIAVRRRAVTSDEMVRKHAASVQNEAALGLRRQPSFKHRFLNRMMSGLTTRTQVDHILEADEQSEQSSPKADFRNGVSRFSLASSNTDTYSPSDLDSALASFPTPPTSNVTSPTTTRSSLSADSHAQAYKDLCAPSRDVTVGAELRMISEYDHHGSDRSTLVAIEIRAAAADGLLDHEMQSQQNGLDIAVVIDNSLYNSPDTLMASCEITRLLASLLDGAMDRMVVLSTLPSGANPATHEPSVVSPLGTVILHNLKAALDGITSTTTQTDTEVIPKAVRNAQHILTKSKRPATENVRDTFGHIFVLTAGTSGLCGEYFIHERIQTHILFPSLPPQRRWDEVECDGWKLSSLSLAGQSLQPPRAMIFRKDTDPHSLSSRLQALLRHARRGRLADHLTDLVLDIQPGPHCSIEKIMGWSKYSKLQIGELKTVLVRLNVESEPRTPTYDITRLCYFDDSAAGENLMTDLDEVLGLSNSEILTAKLTYKHSSLPANTICTVIEACHPSVTLPVLESKQLTRRSGPPKSRVLVHQLLADHYAVYHNPQDAMSRLFQEFGEGGCRSACPLYVASLTNELKYQARVAERIAIMNSPQKPADPPQDPHPGTLVTRFNSEPVDDENHRPQDWITVPEEEVNTLRNSHVEVAEQLGLDDARRIWNDLRNMSRSDSTARRGTGPVSTAHQERAKKITELTLRNKRSIGESTIRSFSTPIRSSRRGRIVPWL